MPDFLKVRPEAKFAHYLMMAAALGERAVTAPGRAVQRLRELGRHRADAHLVRPARRGLAMTPPAEPAMTEYRRILLDGAGVQVRRDGDELVAGDGRRVAAADAVHLPPCTPTKIVAVHLNHRSRVAEFGARCPPRRRTSTSRSRRWSATAAPWSGRPGAST